MWEVMGRGYVCSAWDCESRGEEGIRWPSFQAVSHISELCPSHLPWAPGGNPAPTTPDFVFGDSTPTPSPKASWELSCPYEMDPCGNALPPHCQGLGLAGAPPRAQPTSAPAQDSAFQPRPWGTDTPESPPCCLLPIHCCHVLVSWLPLDPPESPSFLSPMPPQRESSSLIPCGHQSGCFPFVYKGSLRALVLSYSHL